MSFTSLHFVWARFVAAVTLHTYAADKDKCFPSTWKELERSTFLLAPRPDALTRLESRTGNEQCVA